MSNPSIEYCQETTLGEQRLDLVYKKTCYPTNENSRWFYFEISNPTDLLIITNTDSPWSLYSYTGSPCPAELNALTELECSLTGGFNSIFDAGKYYVQLDGSDESQSCVQINYFAVFGCTDFAACNYNPSATVNDESSCDYTSCDVITGCTDPNACNYNPAAAVDNGTCDLGDQECPDPCNAILGCIGADALNFNPIANCDDGSCQYANAACDNTEIINEFPWLNDVFDFNNCTGASINFYNFGDYKFVEIAGDGNNKLYFQDGSLYCEDTQEFSCADNYCLHVQTSTWECCGVEEDGGINTDVCQAVSTYPWIADMIDIENCENGFIKVYDFNTYAFILISDGNENQLYLNDGRLWCTDGLGLDCATAYGLTDDQISEECNCGDTIDGNIANSNVSLEGIFEQYPWIATFIDPNNCTTEKISEYENYGQNYLYIETDHCNALYAEDGSVFCIDTENFNCLDFYNLTNPINNWSCSSDRLENNSRLSTADFKIYPNPNNGYFEISTPDLKEGIYVINIYSLEGSLMQSKSLDSNDEPANISIDLHNAPTGVYQVEILNNFEKITKKVVKH